MVAKDILMSKCIICDAHKLCIWMCILEVSLIHAAQAEILGIICFLMDKSFQAIDFVAVLSTACFVVITPGEIF